MPQPPPPLPSTKLQCTPYFAFWNCSPYLAKKLCKRSLGGGTCGATPKQIEFFDCPLAKGNNCFPYNNLLLLCTDVCLHCAHKQWMLLHPKEPPSTSKEMHLTPSTQQKPWCVNLIAWPNRSTLQRSLPHMPWMNMSHPTQCIKCHKKTANEQAESARQEDTPQ